MQLPGYVSFSYGCKSLAYEQVLFHEWVGKSSLFVSLLEVSLGTQLTQSAP